MLILLDFNYLFTLLLVFYVQYFIETTKIKLQLMHFFFYFDVLRKFLMEVKVLPRNNAHMIVRCGQEYHHWMQRTHF